MIPNFSSIPSHNNGIYESQIVSLLSIFYGKLMSSRGGALFRSKSSSVFVVCECAKVSSEKLQTKKRVKCPKRSRSDHSHNTFNETWWSTFTRIVVKSPPLVEIYDSSKSNLFVSKMHFMEFLHASIAFKCIFCSWITSIIGAHYLMWSCSTTGFGDATIQQLLGEWLIILSLSALLLAMWYFSYAFSCANFSFYTSIYRARHIYKHISKYTIMWVYDASL